MKADARQSHVVSSAPGLSTAFDRSLIAMIVAVAAAIRLANLDSSLWIDEIMMLMSSAREPIGRIMTVYSSTNQHTFYDVLAHAAIVTLGESAWSIRLPACLFGIASVAMIYLLAARLLSRTEALAAAAILATSYHHVWYSQSARGYTIQGFCALASTYALLRGLEHGRRRDWGLYVAASVVGIYTHLTMALVVAAQVLIVTFGTLMGWRAVAGLHVRGFAWSVGAVAAVSLALYAPMQHRIVASVRPNRLKPSYAETSSIGWMVLTMYSAVVGAVGLPTAVGGMLMGLTGVHSLWRRHRLAAALLLVPAAMVFLVFVALARSLFPRFLFFLSGMAVLFLVRGLGVVAESITPRGRTNRSRVVALVTALGALMIVAASVPGLVRNYRIPKQNFSGAVRFLDEAEASGARIVVASACGTFREYFERSNWTCVANGEQLRAIRTHTSQRTLVVATLPVFLQPSLRERLRDDSTVVQRFPGTLGGGTIVVYEVRPVG